MRLFAVRVAWLVPVATRVAQVLTRHLQGSPLRVAVVVVVGLTRRVALLAVQVVVVVARRREGQPSVRGLPVERRQIVALVGRAAVVAVVLEELAVRDRPELAELVVRGLSGGLIRRLSRRTAVVVVVVLVARHTLALVARVVAEMVALRLRSLARQTRAAAEEEQAIREVFRTALLVALAF